MGLLTCLNVSNLLFYFFYFLMPPLKSRSPIKTNIFLGLFVKRRIIVLGINIELVKKLEVKEAR
jgi:hypothetical protein